MTASQMPGQTLQPLPADSGPVSDDVYSLLQKSVENAYNWAAANGFTGLHADYHDDDFELYRKLDYNVALLT